MGTKGTHCGLLLQPMVTHPIPSSQLQPRWEETLLFNEKAWYFTHSKHTLVFFELLDFPSTLPSSYPAHSTASPWHRIAWAFLRLSEATIGSRCRLQLFHFPRKLQTVPGSVEVSALGLCATPQTMGVSHHCLIRCSRCGRGCTAEPTQAHSM